MNLLTLAVAGGRKTQSIVDQCVSRELPCRLLILTYTTRNQRELSSRFAAHQPYDAKVEVQGWFSFLMSCLVRPYIPRYLTGRKLRGLNFDGDPGRFAKGADRFLDKDGRAYKLHLSRLAYETCIASRGAAIDRLSRMYNTIYIDEVQDLNGYDLEVLDLLLKSSIDVIMVGDIRQAIINTNVRDPKNQAYKGMNIKKWFDKQVAAGRMSIVHATTTWRCSQPIVDLADSMFSPTYGFEKTESQNTELSGHDGVFVVSVDNVEEYVRKFNPTCLRATVTSWKGLDLPFINIGAAKGLGADHVLIAPTANAQKFLQSATPMEAGGACSLYVAVTRARFSVTFVSKQPERLPYSQWVPLTEG